MDFQFTKEQQDIKSAAREFAEKEFPDIAREIDEKEEFPFDLWKRACGLGLIGCFIPEEYGGAGYGVTEHCCIADYLIVYCMTNPEEGMPAKRFSTIIVETDRPGYESNELKGKLGIRASDTSEVRFTDVKVPVGNLVGDEGKGFP